MSRSSANPCRVGRSPPTDRATRDADSPITAEASAATWSTSRSRRRSGSAVAQCFAELGFGCRRGGVVVWQQIVDDAQRSAGAVRGGQPGPVRGDNSRPHWRIGTHRPPQRPDGHLVGHRLESRLGGHLPLRVGLRVGQRFPQSPVDDGGRQSQRAARVGEGVQEGAGRGVVGQPPRTEQTGDRREQHEVAHRRVSATGGAAAHADVELRPEHRGHVVVGHVA